MTTLLQVRDLSKSFGGVRAVDGINFDLHEGELLALCLLYTSDAADE